MARGRKVKAEEIIGRLLIARHRRKEPNLKIYRPTLPLQPTDN